MLRTHPQVLRFKPSRIKGRRLTLEIVARSEEIFTTLTFSILAHSRQHAMCPISPCTIVAVRGPDTHTTNSQNSDGISALIARKYMEIASYPKGARRRRGESR